MSRPKCSHSPSLSGYIALIGLYYCVGILYFHLHMNLPISDTLYIITAALTASGQSFLTPHDARVPIAVFSICGVIVSLYILSGFIISEVKHAKQNIVLNRTGMGPNPVRMTMTTVYITRLVYPLLHMACVILIGTIFFSFNENWPWTDALFYSVVLKSAGVRKCN